MTTGGQFPIEKHYRSLAPKRKSTLSFTVPPPNIVFVSSLLWSLEIAILSFSVPATPVPPLTLLSYPYHCV